jgi:hypothetical protein
MLGALDEAVSRYRPSRIAADRHDDDRHDDDRHRKHFGIGHQSQLLGLELIVDGAR